MFSVIYQNVKLCAVKHLVLLAKSKNTAAPTILMRVKGIILSLYDKVDEKIKFVEISKLYISGGVIFFENNNTYAVWWNVRGNIKWNKVENKAITYKIE